MASNNEAMTKKKELAPLKWLLVLLSVLKKLIVSSGLKLTPPPDPTPKKPSSKKK